MAIGVLRMVSGLRNSTSMLASDRKQPRTRKACVGLSSPDASGRTRVRVTCRSKDRSAKSFNTTPALRITKDPVTKMANKRSGGMPRAAKTKDQRVGSMSSQVPVWFWRRMSRLMADQESRGDRDSCSGEEDSVMWLNLAEGCEAVNDETRRLVSLVCLVYLVCLVFG